MPCKTSKCLKMTKNLYAPQFRFNFVGNWRIMFTYLFVNLFFWLWCVLIGLRKYVKSFGKICWRVSDLWTSRQIDTTRTKMHKQPGSNGVNYFCKTPSLWYLTEFWINLCMVLINSLFWFILKKSIVKVDANVREIHFIP